MKISKELDLKNIQDKIIFATQYGKKIDLPLAKSIYESITSFICDASTLELSQTSSDSRVGDYLWYQYNKFLRN